MAEQVKSGQAPRLILLVAAGLLGGCEIVPDPGAPLTAAQAPATASAATSPQREIARNRVAVLVPFTGPDAEVGQSIANAVALALSDSRGDRVRIAFYDTGQGAAAAADRALAEGNRLFLGPLLAEEVAAVAPAARAAGVPIVAFSNDASVAGNGIYLMGFNPGQSIERVALYARGKGARRFAGLIPQGLYGERAGEAFRAAVERAGGQVVGVQTYARNPAAVRAAVGRLNATGTYDAILIADGSRIAAAAAPAVRKGARIIGTELWGTEADPAKPAVLNSAWFAGAPSGMFDQLSPRYRARFGTSPHRLASLGYDAMLMTVRLSANWPVGQSFPEQALRAQGFTGIDGPFRFWRDGVADRSLAVQQIGPDGVTTISAASDTR